MTELQKAAFTYIKPNGHRPPLPIFAIAPNAKTPMQKGGFYNATIDEPTIRETWSRYPTANIGFRPEGIIALDIDRHNPAEDGFESLHEMEREHKPLPDTWICLTPTGGEHWYFRCNDPRLTSGAGVRPGIDYRGCLGYVLLPPSVHPNGKAYLWDAGHRPDDTPLADLPEWLHDVLLAATSQPKETNKTFEVPEQIESGQRNDLLFRTACSFRAKGLTEREMFAAVDAVNQERCNPPLDGREVRAICESAGKYERGDIIPAPVKADAKTAKASDLFDLLKQLKPHANYEWSDRGAGKLFGDVFQHSIRYNVTAKEWFCFTGRVWEQDTGGMRTAQRAKMLSDALLAYCTTIDEEKTRSAYTKYVSQFGRFSARETMIKDARSEHFISQTDLDQNTALFNCRNGTLDLNTGEFREHRASDLLSKISNAHYEPEAKSEMFERFMSDVMQGDEDKIRYLQRIFGYCLTAETDLETCWFLYGKTTRNGKSTLVETISHMMGDYALSTTPEVLALKKNKDSRNASGDIARLDGARFLSVPEPPKKMLLDVATLKTLIGRDTIVARRLYQSEFEFVPVFKLIVNTNFLPVVQDETLFSSGRVNVVTFDKHFEPSEQDTTLKAKLRRKEEVSGILNWCLQGLKDYRELGLEPPASVIAATEDYRASSDKLGLFLTETMMRTGGNTGAGAAYQRYSEWCSDNGFGTDSKSSFFDALKSKGLFAPTGTVDGRTVRNVLLQYTFDELPA